MTRTAGPSQVEIPADWLAEFEAAARQPLEQRFRYAFIKTYKPSSTTRRSARSTPRSSIAAGARPTYRIG